MAKVGGRQVEVGIGVETTAGTPVAAADYFKWEALSLVAYSDKTPLNSARGIRNKASNNLITKQYGKGSIDFVATVDMLPYVLGLLLGTRNSATAAGESIVYNHTFTVQNANASMKTATILIASGGVQTERYANCVVDSFDFSVDKDFAKCKIGLLTGYPDGGTITSSYTQDTMFSRNQLFAYFSTTLANAAGTAASTTLTSTGVFSDGETVSVGSLSGPTIVYTMKAALTNSGNTPYEVLIGAAATNSLDNIKSAVNGTGTPGTTYGNNTQAHPSVIATTKSATTLLIVSKTTGTTANSITTTKSAANFAWTGATMNSGTPGTGPNPAQLVSFAFNVANSILFEDAFLAGAATPAAGAYIAGPLMIKGSYVLQFSDTVELAKYKANTKNALIVQMLGAPLGVVPTLEQMTFKFGRLELTKAPIEYQIDGIMLVKQEFEVEYDGTDKELTAVITNGYVGTNYQ